MSTPKPIHEKYGGEMTEKNGADLAIEIFRCHDVNCDGILQRRELQRLFSELDPVFWSNDRVDELIRQADADKNGKIDYGELLDWLYQDSKYRNYVRCQNLLDGIKTCIEFGNTAQRIDDKTFAWTFYVRGGGEEDDDNAWISQCIQQVIVQLHPTFKDPIKTLSGPPFKLDSRGWGTFPLMITVKWICGAQSEFTWMLQFDRLDSCRKAYVPMSAWRYYQEGSDTAEVAAVETVGGGTCEKCGGRRDGGIECIDACLCNVDLSGDYRVYGCSECLGLRSPDPAKRSCTCSR